MSPTRRILGIFAILLLLVSTIQAGDWPMFHHNARHTGNINESFPDDLEFLWSFEIGGYVSSSPAVANGKVFVSYRDHLANIIYCLNEKTGKVIWDYETGKYVESSLAVTDGKVFVGSTDGKIYCLDEKTGKQIWSSSPAVADGIVIRLVDDCVEWKDSVYSSPAVADGKVFVGSKDNKTYCLDEKDGNLIWSYKTEDSVRYSSPAVANGKVFVGSTAGKIYCLDEKTGKLLWRYNTGDSVYSSPAVADGKVFVGSGDKIYCLDEDNGNLIWCYETGKAVYSSPAVADNKVFVGSNDNKTYCLEKNTGRVIWSYETGGAVVSSPAVADGKVFVGSKDNKIYCLDGNNGNVIWSYETGSIVQSSPAIANGKVFVCSWDHKLYCFGSKPPESSADLFVTSEDITFYPDRPEEGDLVRITANIHNIGETDANNFTVSFFDYFISSNIIDNKTISVRGNSTSQCTIICKVKPYVGYYINVVVDSGDVIDETNETNNEARRRIQVNVIHKPYQESPWKNPAIRLISTIIGLLVVYAVYANRKK
jgi:outer membrane protein assembly factor BamB